MGLKTKALLLGGLAGAVYWQNAALDRHQLICVHPALPKAFDGFSILHLRVYGTPEGSLPEIRPS